MRLIIKKMLFLFCAVLVLVAAAFAVQTLSGRADVHAAASKKSWGTASGQVNNKKLGWCLGTNYYTIGMCTGYVAKTLTKYYGAGTFHNSYVSGLESQLKAHGAKLVLKGSSRLGRVKALWNASPGDIIVFDSQHIAIRGSGGVIYHAGTSFGCCVRRTPISLYSFYVMYGGISSVRVYRLLSPAKGKLAVSLKSGTNSAAVSAASSVYSKKGARYAVYTKKGKRVATLTGNASGKTKTVRLKTGKYYVKQTKAPSGFVRSSRRYSIRVKYKKKKTVSITNNVKVGKIVLTCTGSTSGTSKKVSAASGSTESTDTLCKVEYFGTYQHALPAKAVRTWYVRADEKGSIVLDSTHKVKGDAFFFGNTGKLPFGTVRVTVLSSSGDSAAGTVRTYLIHGTATRKLVL